MEHADGPAATAHGRRTAGNAWGGGSLGNNVETTLGGGDSGGPSFVNVNGQLKIFAVNTYGFGNIVNGQVRNPPRFGSGSGGIVVSAYMTWINSVLNNGGGTNTAPVANNDSAVVARRGTVTINVLSNDTDAQKPHADDRRHHQAQPGQHHRQRQSDDHLQAQGERQQRHRLVHLSRQRRLAAEQLRDGDDHDRWHEHRHGQRQELRRHLRPRHAGFYRIFAGAIRDEVALW